MKPILFSLVVFISLSSFGSAQDAKVTVELAKELLPGAAGISNTDFQALAKDRQPEIVKSKSLSLVILALRPPQAPIPFVAEATMDGWIITEFRLPHYDIRVVRGKDGVWRQEALTGK